MLDIRLLDDVFEMHDGYVLDFSNATFSAFFCDELGIEIDNPQFAAEGGSKAKRLRYFLRKSPPGVAASSIVALWEYRETLRRRAGTKESIPNAEAEIAALVSKLGGRISSTTSKVASTEHNHAVASEVITSLSGELIELSKLEPHPCGYAFEKFLKTLFDAYGLGARAAFRLQGEQIDGSFELGNETYLLEAKWTNIKTDAATLRSFDAKVQDKAVWSRGLFVSQSGFTEEGLHAFGRGKRIVCMDGLDLYEMLNNGHHFPDVLAKKVRRAAETGNPFIRVRDLGFH